MSNPDLAGLRVMVTAGASGIGLAIAQAFAECGARLHVSDISEAALSSMHAQHREWGWFRCDASSEQEVDRWFGAALAEMGGLDVLVNNAGIAGPTAGIEDISVQEWDATMATNVRSQYLCVRRGLPALRQSDRAAIINLSSVAGKFGYRMRTPYAASKWAVVGLTESLAIELGPDDICVNAILPGIVDSARVQAVASAKAAARGISVDEMKEEILSQVSLGRMVPMEDIARTAVFLASPAGRSMTGQSLTVCAGVRSLS